MNVYRPYLEQFDSNFVWRLLFVLCSVALIIAVSDAFANTVTTTAPNGGTPSDPVGAALCKMIKIFRGNTARGIAVIAIVVLGIQTLRGQLKWEVALVIVTGVIILFKAPEIINMVAGTAANADKCV
ncbi:TrbC/VirB2 family type IV secretion system protein [Rickettsia endosymbiont of Oedothorax gibbosus]|uniref:TrbC/VirB2 family protein n=1 Tax=Rickettsia endosymbiont of Oedothorax gibbosus TaxID=931099 RepID=UPI002024C8F2|nr:TrbC/VirB2 family protein [Rickettsia endosymbiont of Oedothorax gibbosus]